MNQLHHNNSSIFPLINQLPLNQNERYLYAQLYGVNYQQQQQQQQQQFNYNQDFNPYLSSLNYGYQSNFIPAYSTNQKLPYIQSQIIDPLPINYNLGLMVHQPQSQIRLAFDLSDFGLPKEPPKPQRVIVKKKIPEPIYKPPEFDYFEQAEIPKIYLSNEQQFRIIKNKENFAKRKLESLDKEIQLEKIKFQTTRHQQNKEDISNQDKQNKVEEKSQDEQQIEKQNEKKKRRLAKKLKEDKNQKREVGNYKKPCIIKFKKVVRRVKNMLWFGQNYIKTMKNQIQKNKEEQQKKYQNNQKEVSEMMQDNIFDAIYDFVLELVNTTDSLTVQIGQDKQNTQSKKKISALLDMLSTNLIKDFKVEEIIVGQLAMIMNNIIQSYQFPPQKAYSKFEILRIPTTQFGSLGEMNENCQKMILMIFIVLKQITFNFIFRAWEQHPDQSQDNHQQLLRIQQNSTIITSIIHELIIKWIEKNVPIQNDLKLQELEKNFQFYSKPLTTEKQQPNKEYPVSFLIDGVMASTLVQKYINNNKGEKEPWIVKFEDTIQKFINSILQQLNKEYTQAKKLIKKQKLSEMMNNYINSK